VTAIPTFTFSTAPRVVFGAGESARLADHASGLLGGRVLLITDPGLVRLGLHEPALRSLTASGAEVEIFDRVEEDPSRATVEAATEMARTFGATSIVGVGGGSPLDVAKVTALLAGSDEDLDDLWGVDKARGPRLPLVLVPTTAGTGSEVTPVAILTLPGDEKRGISTRILLPDIAILDPELTLGLPPSTTAATGIDAMVHAIEAYASKSANNNPISRALAVEALKLLGANIRQVAEHPDDRDARGAMLLGSMLAGQAFANSPVAAVHALAYPIGGRFHVPHGLSNALVLPHTLRFNAADGACGAHELYAELAPYVFPDLGTTEQGSQARCAAFIDRLARLAQDLALPTRLRDVGVGEDDLGSMARDAMLQTRLLVNNPRPVEERDALAIYRAAW
jgi:alcohol dehydrogenase class IV